MSPIFYRYMKSVATPIKFFNNRFATPIPEPVDYIAAISVG
jgi:hypothetical protein